MRAGRPAEAIQVVAGAVTVVDRDGARARAWARRHAAMYLPVIAPWTRRWRWTRPCCSASAPRRRRTMSTR